MQPISGLGYPAWETTNNPSGDHATPSPAPIWVVTDGDHRSNPLRPDTWCRLSPPSAPDRFQLLAAVGAVADGIGAGQTVQALDIIVPAFADVATLDVV